MIPHSISTRKFRWVDPWNYKIRWPQPLPSKWGMICVYVYLVVSNIFYFHPYLGKIPILTNIFQMGWNHQLGVYFRVTVGSVAVTALVTRLQGLLKEVEEHLSPKVDEVKTFLSLKLLEALKAPWFNEDFSHRRFVVSWLCYMKIYWEDVRLWKSLGYRKFSTNIYPTSELTYPQGIFEDDFPWFSFSCLVG